MTTYKPNLSKSPSKAGDLEQSASESKDFSSQSDFSSRQDYSRKQNYSSDSNHKVSSVFPNKAGETFISEKTTNSNQPNAKLDYTKVKLAGLSEEENKKLNYILSGGRTDFS